MKQVTFSKKSWHWLVATRYGDLDFNIERYEPGYVDNSSSKRYPPGNICSYAGCVLRGLFRIGAILLACSILSYPIGTLLGWIAACIGMLKWIIPTGPVVGTLIVISYIIMGVLLSFGIVNGIARFNKKRYKAVPVNSKPDSFMKHAYRRFKDKTCFRIVVDHNET